MGTFNNGLSDLWKAQSSLRMCTCGRPRLLFFVCAGISYTTQCLKDRGLKKLKLHPGWPKRFHVSRRQTRLSGTWGAAGPPPPAARRAPSLHRPGRGTTVHTGPWRSGSGAWQCCGRHQRGRTWPAALKRRGGPGRSTCGRAAGCCSCEPPLAGRDPHRTLALVRLAPDSFPSLSPFLPLPRPWLKDGGAETDHVSGERVR